MQILLSKKIIFSLVLASHIFCFSSDWAESTPQEMTLDQKIGQLFMVAAVSNEILNAEFIKSSPYTMHQEYIEQLICDYHIGGIIFLGMGYPEQQIARTCRYQSLSRIPLLVGQDLEWGLSMRLHDVARFPRAMTLGAISDEQLIYDMAKEIAHQAQALGVHIVFAPVVDVNNNPRNPVIHDRSFGQDPHAVARKGLLFMQGLCDEGIIACAKHFPGHGDTEVDSHFALPCVTHTRQRLNEIELYPFKELIAHHAPAIMLAHLRVPALDPRNLPTSLSYNVVTNVLRNELAFDGLIITDGMGMQAITNDFTDGAAELQALLAGNDIILCPTNVPQACKCIKRALADGVLTEADLNEHVLRILRAKQWASMAQKAAWRPSFDYSALHSPYAYQLKQKLYEQAITLVRNNNALPINQRDEQTVAYIQVGGQNKNAFATTLHETVSHAYYLPAQPDDVALNETLSVLEGTDKIIIGIFDMNKRVHIEQSGQICNYGIAEKTCQLLAQLTQAAKNIILVLFGSPYSIQLFEHVPTVIVAYEDDSDAQIAAANVILGKLVANGRLPVGI